MIELEVEAEFGRRRLQHPDAFRHDFLADAVSRNDGDAMCPTFAHFILLHW